LSFNIQFIYVPIEIAEPEITAQEIFSCIIDEIKFKKKRETERERLMYCDSKMITFEQGPQESPGLGICEESNFHFDNVCTTFLTRQQICFSSEQQSEVMNVIYETLIDDLNLKVCKSVERDVLGVSYSLS
jgi:hypothetical protein